MFVTAVKTAKITLADLETSGLQRWAASNPLNPPTRPPRPMQHHCACNMLCTAISADEQHACQPFMPRFVVTEFKKSKWYHGRCLTDQVSLISPALVHCLRWCKTGWAAYTCRCIYIYTHIHIYLYIYTHIMFLHTHIHLYKIRVYIFIYLYIYSFIHSFIYLFIYYIHRIYIYTRPHVAEDIDIYVYTQLVSSVPKSKSKEHVIGYPPKQISRTSCSDLLTMKKNWSHAGNMGFRMPFSVHRIGCAKMKRNHAYSNLFEVSESKLPSCSWATVRQNRIDQISTCRSCWQAVFKTCGHKSFQAAKPQFSA